MEKNWGSQSHAKKDLAPKDASIVVAERRNVISKVVRATLV